ncbi:MAG: hypothetical protein GXO35_07120, partial [Gammaproteobacteria bacterium]|nr:hypothetical protein [Gammaproteobacteria bacterium]
TPEYEPIIQHWDYSLSDIRFNKADEIGRFNMGSTVVLLTPEGQLPELGKMTKNTPIQMGQHLANYPPSEKAVIPDDLPLAN